MCVNLRASWQGRLAKMPNIYSHSRKHSQQDCFLKNWRGTVLWISRARSPTGLLVRKSKRHRSPNFESQISLDKACLQYSHATSAFQIQHTTFSKRSDKVKICEACSFHYIAMTKKGKWIALLLVVGETPIYVDLHPSRIGRPAKMLNPSSYLRGHSQRSLSKYSTFFPPDNTYANKEKESN